MYGKILKIMEYGFRVTKLGYPIARISEKLIGEKKEYIAEARKKLQELHYEGDVSCITKERTWMKQYDLQIVIPMHNATKYMHHCIDSVLSQKTKYTYQVVLVDDGSTDGTIEKAQSYLSDPKVCLITQKNAGAAVARNSGLQNLTGNYVMFVDIDDALKEDAVETLLNIAYKEKAQIVEGGYEIFDTKVLFTQCHSYECLEEACGVLWGFPWGKVIDTSLLQEVAFPKGYWYEDTIMSYLVYPRSKKTVTIEEVVYCYRKNPSGFSHIRGNNEKLLDTCWVMELMLRDMKELNIHKRQSIYEQYLQSVLTGSKRLMFMKKSTRKAVLTLYSQMLNNDWEGYKTQDKNMKAFEKAVRNNRYGIYKFLVLCL